MQHAFRQKDQLGRFFILLVCMAIAYASSPVVAATTSSDGTILQAGTSGSVTTAAGNWSFGTDTAASGNVIVLNGKPLAGSSAVEMLVTNGGQLYVDSLQGNWYKWTNAGWIATASPLASSSLPVATVPSPDGTILMAGAGGSVATAAGTWTFGTASGPGGSVVFLNGQAAAGGSAVEMLISNGGQLYVETKTGNWYKWGGLSWAAVAPPTMACGSVPAGSSVTKTVSTTPGSTAATAVQCPYGGTQPTLTTVIQAYRCTGGTLVAQGSPVSSIAAAGDPSCSPASMVGAAYTFAALSPGMADTIGFANPSYAEYVSPSSPVAAVAGDVSEQFMAPNGQVVTVTVKSPVTTTTYTAPAMAPGENPVTYFKQQIAAAGSGSRLVIPKGTYDFPAIDCTNTADPDYLGQYILIQSLHDMIVDGQGSTLNFVSDCLGVRLQSVSRVSFVNFTIDWPNLQASAVATVVAVNGRTYDLQVPVANIVKDFGAVTPWDETDDHFSLTQSAEVNYYPTSSYNFSPDGLAVGLPNNKFKVGDSVLVRHFGANSAILVFGSQDVTMDTVTLHAAPSVGLNFGDGRGIHLNNFHVERVAGRPLSTTAGAILLHNSGGDIIVENSTFAYQGDDGLSTSARMVPVPAVPSCPASGGNCPWTFQSNFGIDVATGDEIALFDPSMRFMAAVPTSCVGRACTINIASIAAAGGFLGDLSYSTPRYIVRNNTFTHNRGRGVLLGSPYGLVENNVFTGQSWWSMYIESSFAWDLGLGAQNVLFLGNQVSSPGMGNISGYGAVTVASEGANYAIYNGTPAVNGQPPLPAIEQNLVFAKNAFSNLPGAALYISSANDVILYENTFANTNLNTSAATPLTNAPIAVYDASNVLLNGNVSDGSSNLALFDASDGSVTGR